MIMGWKKRFGGSGYDYFKAVLEDGYVVVGYSDSFSIGNGNWESIKGKGQDDAIIVKYSLKDLSTKNITPN